MNIENEDIIQPLLSSNKLCMCVSAKISLIAGPIVKQLSIFLPFKNFKS